MIRFPLSRFHELAPITPEEAQQLEALGDSPMGFRRGNTIRDEGVPADALYLLIEGWVSSSMLMPSGERQIFKIHVPGDMLGSPSMTLEHAAEALTALTSCTVARVPFTRMRDMFAEKPRLGSLFLMACQLERVALMDAVASMGRSSAAERLVTFLLDMHRRIAKLGLAQDGVFDLPINQIQLAEIIGVTSVHMNRLLRDLREQGLVERHGPAIHLLDLDALAAQNPLPARSIRYDPDWLQDD